jgi:hypothetical protein
MKTRLIFSLVIAAALALIPAGATWAHGEPIITVEPAVVAAGREIKVTGTEMEPGEVFVITLEGLAGSFPLGEVTVVGEGEEGGFTATFTIPADAKPGAYRVSATAEDGDTASADLAVTAPSEKASKEPAMTQEPTGELHQIDRTKPIGQIIGIVAVAALSAAAGFLLIRNRG